MDYEAGLVPAFFYTFAITFERARCTICFELASCIICDFPIITKKINSINYGFTITKH